MPGCFLPLLFVLLSVKCCNDYYKVKMLNMYVIASKALYDLSIIVRVTKEIRFSTPFSWLGGWLVCLFAGLYNKMLSEFQRTLVGR